MDPYRSPIRAGTAAFFDRREPTGHTRTLRQDAKRHADDAENFSGFLQEALVIVTTRNRGISNNASVRDIGDSGGSSQGLFRPERRQVCRFPHPIKASIGTSDYIVGVVPRSGVGSTSCRLRRHLNRGIRKWETSPPLLGSRAESHGDSLAPAGLLQALQIDQPARKTTDMPDVKTRSNAPKGEREFVATRIPAADKPKLVERARQAGLSVSEYLDRLIAEDLKKAA